MLSKVDLKGSEELQLTDSSARSQVHGVSVEEEEIFHESSVGYLGTVEIPSSEGSSLRDHVRRIKAEKRRVHSSVRFSVLRDRIRLYNQRRGSLFAEFILDEVSFSTEYPDEDPKLFAILVSKSGGASCHVFTMLGPASSAKPLVNLVQSLVKSDDSFNTRVLELQNSAQNLRVSAQKYLFPKRNGADQKPFNFLECSDTLAGLLPLADRPHSVLDPGSRYDISKSVEELDRRCFYNSEKDHFFKREEEPDSLNHILKPSDLYPLEHGVPKPKFTAFHTPKSNEVSSRFSNPKPQKTKTPLNQESPEPKFHGRVKQWSLDFESLLLDPIGVDLFGEFLKTEFSHENISFWSACQKYKKTLDLSERKKLADSIMEQYLSPGASDPINVDSDAKLSAQKSLSDAPFSLFQQAQNQIFNLMKYDSYRRFLKSDVFSDCLEAEASGKSLPTVEPKSQDPPSFLHDSIQDKKSKNLAYARRKSLLPFSFKGNNNVQLIKGKDPLEQKKSREMMSSKFSKSSQPIREDPESPLVRIILPDKATTVVQVRSGESIRSMIARLLEKRGLSYTSFDAFVTNSDKPLDLGGESTSLGSLEIRVEPRNLFRMELPSKKSIGVKAKPTKRIYEVLRPILLQYGWNLSAVNVKLENQLSKSYIDINLSDFVCTIDNSRLVISDRTDEICPKLLEELLMEKSNYKQH